MGNWLNLSISHSLSVADISSRLVASIGQSSISQSFSGQSFIGQSVSGTFRVYRITIIGTGRIRADMAGIVSSFPQSRRSGQFSGSRHLSGHLSEPLSEPLPEPLSEPLSERCAPGCLSLADQYTFFLHSEYRIFSGCGFAILFI